ncbi:hypothetical protein FRC17_009395, partial [Serendipita sp. 399]
LSCYNFWRARRLQPVNSETPIYHQRRVISASQQYKYTYISVTSIFSLIYGMLWILAGWIFVDPSPTKSTSPWYTTMGIPVNRDHYKDIYEWSREFMDRSNRSGSRTIAGFAFTIPVAGIQVFLCFGLGSESQKIYADWWRNFLRSIKDTRIYGSLRVLAGKLMHQRRPPPVDPYHFTPFLVQDVLMEDLSRTSSIKKDDQNKKNSWTIGIPPPPAYIPPRPDDAFSNPPPIPLLPPPFPSTPPPPLLQSSKIQNRDPRSTLRRQDTSPTNTLLPNGTRFLPSSNPLKRPPSAHRSSLPD